jgi:predicted ATPase
MELQASPKELTHLFFDNPLANSFLAQTKKKLRVEPPGHLTVNVDGDDAGRPLHALSSGERQLVIMLAHLSLNPRLEGSGVFIVDEPELSLHLGWQELFVDAIREANTSVQLILATHSPAIIMEKLENCRSLS